MSKTIWKLPKDLKLKKERNSVISKKVWGKWKKKVVQKQSIHTPRENNINNVVKEDFSSEHIHPDIVFTWSETVEQIKVIQEVFLEAANLMTKEKEGLTYWKGIK